MQRSPSVSPSTSIMNRIVETSLLLTQLITGYCQRQPVDQIAGGDVELVQVITTPVHITDRLIKRNILEVAAIGFENGETRGTGGVDTSVCVGHHAVSCPSLSPRTDAGKQFWIEGSA